MGQRKSALDDVERFQVKFLEAYKNKRVLLTGHTGFKGSWLTVWLEQLGAQVFGLSLEPEAKSMFDAVGAKNLCTHSIGDIRNFEVVRKAVRDCKPDVVLHLAAQALVRKSYDSPLETLESNVNGTAHVLEAIRLEKQRCAVVIVSSDKCYENREWVFGYREDDAMGGYDPYSMSKGATELVASSWRRSFFPPKKLSEHGVAVGSARAGNVIGGGDWAADRIVPDAIRALSSGQPLRVRNPHAVRPWQHVIEPLSGYLALGAKLLSRGAADYCEAFNFGPGQLSAVNVGTLADALVNAWGSGKWIDESDAKAVHEASLLRLSIDKAQAKLGWSPKWNFEQTIERTVGWYKSSIDAKGDLLAVTRRQLSEYQTK
jgi:CDP-glucose 4,6-dehydratase